MAISPHLADDDSSGGRGDPVEQLVLTTLEIGDLGEQVLAMTIERRGMAAGVSGLELGERGLRDQGAQGLVVGLRGHHRELLIDLSQFMAEFRQTGAILR